MSFVATELILENFGSFRGVHRLKLPKEPGLYFMRGENREEPRLGANGAGKSTAWKALCWVLWGKTANGLKASDVSSWGVKKGTEVTLAFEGSIEGASNWYFLKRTWKPNSWTLSNIFDAAPIDLTKDETNPALAMLRLQYESFLHSIYMAQRGEMFLDLKPEPKAQLFSSVMDLDRWLKYSQDASQAANDQDKISRRLESERAELKGRLEESGSEDLEASAAQWELKQGTLLSDLHRDYKQVLARSHKAKKRLQDAVAAEERTRERQAVLVAVRNTHYEQDDKAWKDLRVIDDEIIRLERDLEHAIDHLKRVSKNENCPTCGQKFEARKHITQIDEAVRAEEQVTEAIEVAVIKRTKLRKARELTEQAFRDADREHQQALDRREDALQDVKSARREHETEERHLDQLEEEAERLENAPNPFAAMVKEKQDGRVALQNRYAEITDRLEQSYERHALYNFWVRGFKEVRLQLISEALDQLEIEVNSELMELGLVGWKLLFDVDAETKKGTLSRGFSVSVISPHNEERVPWESWSGGESQRLRLAAQCGLSNLIRDRTGCDFPLEVWDEPTEGLSEEGITDLLTALNERAIREQRAIWVVDHRALGYGGFTDTVTVIKDEKGSRIVQARV